MKNLFLMFFVVFSFFACKEGEVGEVNYNTYNYGVDVDQRGDVVVPKAVAEVTPEATEEVAAEVAPDVAMQEVAVVDVVVLDVVVEPEVDFPDVTIGIIATKTLKISLSEFGDNVVVEGDESELAIFKKIHFWTEPAKYENGYYLIASVGPSKVETGRREFPIPADVYYEFFNLYGDDSEETVLLVDAATKTPTLSGKGVNYYCDEKNGCCLLVDLYDFFWDF